MAVLTVSLMTLERGKGMEVLVLYSIESLEPLSFSVWQTQYPHRCEAVWGPSSGPGSGYLSAYPSFQAMSPCTFVS